MTTLVSASSRRISSASKNAFTSVLVSALRLSGRFSVMRATPLSSMRSSVSSGQVFSDIQRSLM